jgi:hypothetical protein
MSASQDKPPRPARSSTALKRYLTRHPFLAFLLMGITFLAVGLISLNMIYMFRANLEFVINNGLMGLRDGGLQQLVELLVTGYLGMALFVLFKACEKIVVERMLEVRPVAAHFPAGGEIQEG